MPLKNKLKIIAVIGPTASGKSDLAVFLAQKFNGEIISADSRQVYKGLNIGSGKITKKEMADIPHHLLDVASPKKTFSVEKFQKLGQSAIKKIIKKGKLPIICGGTGFYIDALVSNQNFPKIKPNQTLRKKLEKMTTQELFNLLKKKDSRRAKNIDPKNRRRLIRAIEITTISKKPVPPIKTEYVYNVLKLGINKNKEELKQRIEKRLIKRLKQGMANEVKKLHQQGVSWKKLESFGLEYRYLAFYLQNKMTKEKMIEELQKEIFRYSKRQMTWFKKDEKTKWIKNAEEAAKELRQFLKN